MSPDTHHQLRAQVCHVIRQLGACLDGLATAAECNRLPDEPATDALCTIMHLEEAACAVESAATFVHDLALCIDRQLDVEKRTAGPFLTDGKGGAS